MDAHLIGAIALGLLVAGVIIAYGIWYWKGE